MLLEESTFKQIQHEVLRKHFDANETAFIERELTQLRSKIFEVVFPELRARTFAPKANDIAASAETYSYKVYEPIGRGGWGSYDAKDAHRVDLKAREETGKVRPITKSFAFNINELREAARTNVPLSELKPRMAREATERDIDQVLAFGGFPDSTGAIAPVGIQGLVNNPDIVANGIGTGSFWNPASPSPSGILADLNSLMSDIFVASKQVFKVNQILLPTAHFTLISQTPYSNLIGDSILSVFLKNNPGVAVDPWYQLDAAGAGGLPRGMGYQKDPMVLEAVIPQEFEMLPPEASAYELITHCHARAGGVKFYQPTASRYVDFATS